MNPLVTRILMVLAGVITAASTVDKYDLKTCLGLLGMFVAGIAALNAPGTPQLPQPGAKK